MTENGYRSVPIPGKILPDTKSYVENLKRRNKIYLFTMRCGQPVTKSSYDKKWARIKRLEKDDAVGAVNDAMNF